MFSKSLTRSKNKIDRISKQIYQNCLLTLYVLDEILPNNFTEKKRTSIPSELKIKCITSLDIFNFDCTDKQNHVLDFFTNQNIREMSLSSFTKGL